MNSRRVALIIPYNKKFDVILQIRKGFINKLTMDYGFFGGGLEKGETVEQALKREIDEELTIDVNNIKSLKFFKTYHYEVKEIDLAVESNVFLCDLQDVEKMDVKEGKPATFKIDDATRLNMFDMDKRILKEINEFIKDKKIN